MHFQRNSKACLGPQDGVHWVVLAHLRGGAGGPEGTLNALRTPPSSVRCRASCLLSGALTRAHSFSQSLRVKVGTQHARIGGARGLTPLLDVCLPPVLWVPLRGPQRKAVGFFHPQFGTLSTVIYTGDTDHS